METTIRCDRILTLSKPLSNPLELVLDVWRVCQKRLPPTGWFGGHGAQTWQLGEEVHDQKTLHLAFGLSCLSPTDSLSGRSPQIEASTFRNSIGKRRPVVQIALVERS